MNKTVQSIFLYAVVFHCIVCTIAVADDLNREIVGIKIDNNAKPVKLKSDGTAPAGYKIHKLRIMCRLTDHRYLISGDVVNLFFQKEGDKANLKDAVAIAQGTFLSRVESFRCRQSVPDDIGDFNILLKDKDSDLVNLADRRGFIFLVRLKS